MMEMLRAIKRITPQFLRVFVFNFIQFLNWRKRKFLSFAPQYVKQNVMLKYGLIGDTWIETGTYFGTTTKFMSKYAKKVHTIEPSRDLYQLAKLNLKTYRNVETHFGTSEEILPQLLAGIHGSVTFWLDGHYSAGVTFEGSQHCPVRDELDSISSNLRNFEDVSILIDDARCFYLNYDKFSDYPSLNEIVDWCRLNQFNWFIEHDIIILRRLQC